jgi:hypothetical protein
MSPHTISRRVDDVIMMWCVYRWAIEILNHDEKLDPCLLSAVLKDADIFLTTHGFQSMGILFMKKGKHMYTVYRHMLLRCCAMS